MLTHSELATIIYQLISWFYFVISTVISFETLHFTGTICLYELREDNSKILCTILLDLTSRSGFVTDICVSCESYNKLFFQTASINGSIFDANVRIYPYRFNL